MKVAFIGAHGVGKTALVYEQAARFKRDGVNVEIVKEVARSCPLTINKETTVEAQTWILMTQIAEEIKAAETAQLVICDRSVLDNFAYLRRISAGLTYTLLTGWLQHWLGTYDLLIKVPFTINKIQEDGVRSPDISFAMEIDATIDSLRYEFSIWGKQAYKWHNLTTDRENWNNEAHQLIKDRL